MILSHLVWKGTNIKDIMKEINEINEKYKVKIMSLEDLEQLLEFHKYQKSITLSQFFSINDVIKLGGN